MMQKTRSDLGGRAWNILRLALLWARKGGVFKNRLVTDLRLRLLPKLIKSIRVSKDQRGALRYGERELSFGDTPIIHVRMHRPSSMLFKMPHIPCINPPHVDFDYDFDERSRDHNDDDNENEMYCTDNDDDVPLPRRSFLKGTAAEEEDEFGSDGPCPCEDEGIDLKAERFIAKFYAQMKLQRQISYLQYNEMISRGTD